jgi:trehalose-6-phosphate synthase
MDRALEEAMVMEEGDRTGRMLMLRERVLTWDVHRWSSAFLTAAEQAGAQAAGRTG